MVPKYRPSLIAAVISCCAMQLHAQGPATAEQLLASNGQVSRVGVELSIGSDRIEQLLRGTIPARITEGATEDLGFMLHADEAVTLKRIERVLTRPAKEAYEEIKRIPRTVTETVKVGTEAYKCYLTPWKWGTCWKDVFKEVKKTVYDEVKVRVEAVPALYKDVVVPFIQINQAIVPIKGKFTYRVDLADLQTSFVDDDLQVTMDMDVNVRIHAYIDHLPRSITPRGNTDVRFKCRVIQKGSTSLNADGKFQLTGLKTHLQILEVHGSDLIVDVISTGIDALPVINYVAGLVEAKVDKILTEKVQEMVDERGSVFDIKHRVMGFAHKFNAPIPLDTLGFLYPNITGIFIAPPQGEFVSGQNILTTRVGVTFQPYALLESDPRPVDTSDQLVQFSTELTEVDRIDVVIPAYLSYPFIAEQGRPLLNEFNEQFKDKMIVKRYALGEPVAQAGPDNSMLLSVEIRRRKNNKRIGELLLRTRVYTSPTDTTIGSHLLDVDLKTSNALLWVLKPFTYAVMRKYADEKGRVSVAKEMRSAAAKIEKALDIRTDFGYFTASDNALGLEDIYAFPDNMMMKIYFRSKLQYIRN